MVGTFSGHTPLWIDYASRIATVKIFTQAMGQQTY